MGGGHPLPYPPPAYFDFALRHASVNSCLTLLANLSIEANSVDPDQTAPVGAARSGSTLIDVEAS